MKEAPHESFPIYQYHAYTLDGFPQISTLLGMRSFCTLLCVAFVSGSGCLAHGRIGETLDQCIERYGEVRNVTEPISGASPDQIIREFKAYRFEKSDYTLLVWFFNDKAAQLVFRKSGMSNFSEDERDLLLSANLLGEEFKIKGANRWESADGAINARIAGSSVLTITTQEFEHHLETQAKQRASEQLQGF